MIDALALTYSGGKGKGKAAWANFVTRYFPQPEYGVLTGLYGGYRSRTLHNASAKHVQFTRGDADAHRHLTQDGSDLILHLESLADALYRAFDAFYSDAVAYSNVGLRALGWFKKNPPVRALPVTSHFSAISASAANSVTRLELDRARPGSTLPFTTNE